MKCITNNAYNGKVRKEGNKIKQKSSTREADVIRLRNCQRNSKIHEK
jgi:hypothetical protein